MLDAVRTAPADLLRADRDHRLRCRAGRSAGGAAAAGGAGPAGDPVVPQRAPARHAGVRRTLPRMAHKVVLDSAGSRDAGRAWRPRGRGRDAACCWRDLAWTRLTRWREMLAQVFENREYLARLPRISTVRGARSAAIRAALAWYMGAWVVDCPGGCGRARAGRAHADRRDDVLRRGTGGRAASAWCWRGRRTAGVTVVTSSRIAPTCRSPPTTC